MKRMLVKVLALVVLGCSMVFASKGPRTVTAVKGVRVTRGVPTKRTGKRYAFTGFQTTGKPVVKKEEKEEKKLEEAKPEEEQAVIVEEESEESGDESEEEGMLPGLPAPDSQMEDVD